MHQPTKIFLDNDARNKILQGVNKVCEPVRRTYGKGGGNFLTYGLYSRPYRISNDGVMCAELIELKDEAENLAAKAVQDAAKRTNLLAGDGTTCTCVITQKIIQDIIPKINDIGDTAEFSFSKQKSQGVMDIKRALFKTREEVIRALKERSKKVETLEELTNIAITSVEHEEYGKIIAEMAWKVGTGGYIDILEGFKGEIETELIEGSRFPAKIPAKVFVNRPERYEMEMLDAPVLLTNYVIDKQIMSVFLGKLKELQKLIIIAPDFKESALVTMAQINKKAGELIYAPVKVPSLKTVQFEDVEAFTGARFINKDRGDKPETISNNHLGFLEKLVVKDADTREDAIALGGKGNQDLMYTTTLNQGVVAENVIAQRITTLKKQLEETRESGQKELLRRRIAGLASAVGIIRVSTDSEAETFYWKKKIEDAVYACRAALEEGYLPGGGIPLKEIAESLPEDDLLRPALLAPYEQIGANMEEKDFTVDENVIDPTKAIRCAVEHAVSVAANLITVKSVIVEEREKSPAEGYQEIAAAIRFYNLLWARERGIKIENELEIAQDEAARHDAILRLTVD